MLNKLHGQPESYDKKYAKKNLLPNSILTTMKDEISLRPDPWRRDVRHC